MTIAAVAPLQHMLKNMAITLASSDMAFGNNLGASGGTTYTGLEVSAGGTVWSIECINVPAMV
jgi:hypothetical protein